MSGFLGGGLIVARGRIAGDGELLAGSRGIASVERTGVGIYTVTFVTDYFATAPFCIAGSNQPCVITEDHGIFACTSASPESVVVDVHNLEGVRADYPFTLHAIQ